MHSLAEPWPFWESGQSVWICRTRVVAQDNWKRDMTNRNEAKKTGACCRNKSLHVPVRKVIFKTILALCSESRADVKTVFLPGQCSGGFHIRQTLLQWSKKKGPSLALACPPRMPSNNETWNWDMIECVCIREKRQMRIKGVMQVHLQVKALYCFSNVWNLRRIWMQTSL